MYEVVIKVWHQDGVGYCWSVALPSGEIKCTEACLSLWTALRDASQAVPNDALDNE